MWKNRLIIAAALLTAAVLYGATLQRIYLSLLLAGVLACGGSLALLHCAGKPAVRVALEAKTFTLQKGERTEAVAEIEMHRSPMPPEIRLYGNADNPFTGESRELLLSEGTYCGNGITRFRFRVSAVHCGKLVLQIQSAELFDPLRLFRRRIDVRADCGRVLAADTFELFIELEPPHMQQIESDAYAADRIGSDPSELLGIRAYREGDPLNRIHWKLSGKYDQPMLKEMAMPVERRILLVFCNCGTSAGEPEKVDAAAEALLSVSQTLAAQKVRHTVAWFEPMEQRLSEAEVTETESFTAMELQLLGTARGAEVEYAFERLLAETLEAFSGRALLFSPQRIERPAEAGENCEVMRFVPGETEETETVFDCLPGKLRYLRI